MKTILIILTSMITTMFYAQSSDEIDLGIRRNNLVLNTIPSLAGKDYFILDAIEGHIAVISKINNNYTYYNIEIGSKVTDVDKIIETKTVNYKPVLDKIFTNFVPKASVKRYSSEYGINIFKEYILGVIYFAIYKNGVKTFDYCLPGMLQGNSKERPIDDETFDFLCYVLFNSDKL